MTRQELRDEISQALGLIPGWLEALPDPQLEEHWSFFKWYASDSKLSAREKALAALGASRAIQCSY